MDKKTFTAEEPCERLDVFLSSALGLTRSAAKKLIDEGNVLLRGAPAKASHAVAKGDEICATIPDPQTLDLTPQDIPIEIVYEDDDIAVINKPQGLTVHAGSGNLTGTLVNALLFRLKSLSSINGVVRPGIVHRIDKDTSGLLIVAKNDAAHRSLAEQIKAHSFTREYRAVVYGRIKADGTVDAPIARHPQAHGGRPVAGGPRSRHALFCRAPFHRLHAAAPAAGNRADAPDPRAYGVHRPPGCG